MLRRSNAIALALGILLGVPAAAGAGHLPPPTTVTCSVSGTDMVADWDDVTDAKKYAVDVIAGYDTNGDGVVDVTRDFDFGTGDRTDGAPMSQSDLTIPLSALSSSFDTDGDGVPDVTLDPVSVDMRVKALHPGRGQGRQNGEFSALCHVLP